MKPNSLLASPTKNKLKKFSRRHYGAGSYYDIKPHQRMIGNVKLCASVIAAREKLRVAYK